MSIIKVEEEECQNEYDVLSGELGPCTADDLHAGYCHDYSSTTVYVCVQ